ncbi:hypothetical protein Tco_0227306 [Tanacetum coccineum]
MLLHAIEQVTNFDDDVDDLALNVDHVFKADQCDAFDSDVDEGPTTQTMFMANLTSEEARASYDSNIPSKVQDREYDSDCEDKYHEVHEMQSMYNTTTLLTLMLTIRLIVILFLIDQDVECTNENMSSTRPLFKEVKGMEEIFDQMSAEVDQNTVDKQYLEAEISKLQNENQKDVNDEMIRGFNKLEKAQLQEKDNAIRNLKAQVSKMNDRSCETYNAKDVHINTSYCTMNALRLEQEKAQLKSKVSCVTSDQSNTKVNNVACSYVNATPTVKIVLNKGKQIWKPKGKLSNNSLNKSKRVWKAMGKMMLLILVYQWETHRKEDSP